MYGLVLNLCWSTKTIVGGSPSYERTTAEICFSWPSTRFEILLVLQAPDCTCTSCSSVVWGTPTMTTSRYCFDLAAGGLCTFSTVCLLVVPGFPVGTSNWTLMRGLVRAITCSSSSLLLLLSVYPFLS